MRSTSEVLWIRGGARTGLAMTALAASTVACANSYMLVDLGAGVTPHAINEVGDIAADLDVKDGSRGIVFFDGQASLLPSGDAPFVYANAIDARGNVAGNIEGRGVIWPRGEASHRVPLPTVSARSTASAMAPDGTVVGTYARKSEQGRITRCYRTTPDGQSIDLGRPGQSMNCYPVGVNQTGEVVVVGRRFSGEGRSFVWQDGVFRDLGSLPGVISIEAHAINSRGQVVGYAATSRLGARAFEWQDGAGKDLGGNKFTGPEANGISDNELIVGKLRPGLLDTSAVRFEDGMAIFLASEVADISTWRLLNAVGVNNHGSIIGTGFLGNEQHGFLLVPQSND